MDQQDHLAINKKVDGVSLFMPLFSYAQEVMDKGSYDPVAGKKKAQEIINKHLRK